MYNHDIRRFFIFLTIMVCNFVYIIIRDWSLITGRGGGGATNREGEYVEYYPYEKGGAKSFSHADVGAHKVFIYAVA